MGGQSYFNEIDPYAAEWLRNLIRAGHIARGDVDTRSIVDVRPDDLRGYVQCHFFAGIGGWSLAARLAGWPDDRPVWTGSCPCQPFSAAGKGGGFDDERHLWPTWFNLIRECRPGVVFGEQVASPAGLGWLDLVHADMESAGYAFAAVDCCSAGVGAPHIRQRLGFVADAAKQGWEPRGRAAAEGDGRDAPRLELGRLRDAGRLADADRGQRDRLTNGEGCERDGTPTGREQGDRIAERGGATRELADTHDARSQGRGGVPERAGERALGAGGVVGGLGQPDRGGSSPRNEAAAPDGHGHSVITAGSGDRPSPTNGFWSNPDWLLCRDGKWRPVESGTFPLAHGIPGRVGRLRAYGNAINPHQFAHLIAAYMECRP